MSRPGIGNKHIFFRLQQEISKNRIRSNDIVLIQWSYVERNCIINSIDTPPQHHFFSSDKEDDVLMHTKATMCRNKNFKYIKRAYEKDEFYDLKQDPGEIKNLIDDPSYTVEIDNLKNKMLSWYQETCDVVPLEGDKRNFN